MTVILETEKELSPSLKRIGLKFSNIYFQNYIQSHCHKHDKSINKTNDCTCSTKTVEKKSSLVIETPLGINRDQIKEIECLTATRFVKLDVRDSPSLGYQTIVEIVFVRT
jgi:hypothetical protein